MNTANDILCHWGIPKMKWRVRRFQNEDGSLTPEGRERYGVGPPREKQSSLKDEAKYIFNNRSKMSDEEFQKALDRLQKEIELGKKINSKDAYKLEIKRGKSWLQRFAKQFSETSAQQVGIQLGVKVGQLIAKNNNNKK